LLTNAVYGFFKNGGNRGFVARVRNAADIPKALEAFESIDEIAIVAAPGLATPEVWDALVSHCERCEDRFAILDSPEVVAKTKTEEQQQSGKEPELDLTLLNYDNTDYEHFLPPRNKNAAFYFPWIQVMDPAKQLQDQDPVLGRNLWTRGRLYVPPSGHLAGIYARTDEERGVHKAPANVTVLGALDLKYYISRSKQELLNPQGVNCIRSLNGNITVWGARTVGGDSNYEWKYISVRRFFLFLRESILDGMGWVVFEPNDPALWGKIRLNVSAFLTNVWRSGALFGLTPAEAFYVKCDAETNPPNVRDLGMVVTEVGVAIVRPAEFVIFRITQETGGRPT
jgi:phage tail sheath protein FI